MLPEKYLCYSYGTNTPAPAQPHLYTHNVKPGANKILLIF